MKRWVIRAVGATFLKVLRQLLDKRTTLDDPYEAYFELLRRF